MNQLKETIQEYMNKNVKPIFDQLLAQLLLARPEDIVSWSINWLQQLQLTNTKVKTSEEQHYQSDEEEDEEDEVQPIQKESKKTNRTGVSAEVYGQFNKKEDFKPRVIEKNKDQIDRIRRKILNSFLFQALDEQNLQTVIDAMEEKKFQPGDYVIRQGDDGNELYVIDEGELECTKKFPNQSQEKFLKKYLPGESFGELALLYNVPRAATIKAIQSVVAFALDRATFNNIVKDAAIRKREQMEQILNKIEILQSMDTYERLQFCDVLREVKYNRGDKVIKQGEQGDTIYLIAEGELEAYKDGQLEKVYAYKSGDYFGELALLKNTPRQASIIAITDCTLYYCDFKSFTRMMGPLEQILRRNVQRYEHYLH
ncbi:unnamed protein product [Paramecium primaurelia]|uniref:cAMP-dependent protein kinase regulatory subunit n=1 Tax=Paramecium primaurelia TaxID=5886 RepID=A0A8S1JR36_PARPR|nr:unnamed protein product [Paramecium primaurelia]